MPRINSGRYNRTRKMRSTTSALTRGRRNPISKAIVSFKRKTFASRVKRIVKRIGETKYVANAPKNNTDFLDIPWLTNANLNAVGDFYPAIPSLDQGDDDHQRDGSVIQPTNLRVKLNFHFNQDLSGNAIVPTNPGQFLVIIYYGTSKKRKSWDDQNPVQSVGELLDRGDGDTDSFSGNLGQLLMPINKKAYTAKRILFKLGKTEGVLSSYDPVVSPGGPVAVAAPQTGGYSTSGGQSFKSITLNFRVPKKLHYENDDSTFPTNYAPWYAVAAMPVNRQTTPYVNAEGRYPPISVTSECQMWYKDF